MNSSETKPFSMANYTIAKKTNSKVSTIGTKKLKPYQLRANIEKSMFQFSDSSYETLNLEHNGLTIAYDSETVCLCIASEKDSKFYKHKGTSNKGKYFKSTALIDLLKERGLVIGDKKINYFSLSNEGIYGNFIIYEISNVDIEKDSNKTIGHVAAAEVENTELTAAEIEAREDMMEEAYVDSQEFEEDDFEEEIA